ncbi:MAG: hypothetical protein EOO27_05535 [Comamonadaceae bacterium]|nr:MAG: hypothetical protein EOO27_05535 [Comamonadaceae bacterium]
MTLSLQIRHQKEVEAQLRKLSGTAMKQAQADALNDTGHQARRMLIKELKSEFDNPTPFIYRSPKFVPATPDRLSIAVLPTVDARNLPSKGGKVGVDPQHVLQAQAFGGRRADKRSEVALRRAGFLPAGMQTALPTDPYLGSDDGRGNIRGAFITQVLSYLQASGEQGYRQNMKDKARAKIEDRTTFSHIKTRKELKTIRGRVYFVSKGPTFGHSLPPGIWAKSGTHGVEVKPVLMFVRRGTYEQRIDLDRVVERADLQGYLDKRVRFRIRKAAGE